LDSKHHISMFSIWRSYYICTSSHLYVLNNKLTNVPHPE